MDFKQAVFQTPCLGPAHYHPGLQALKGYSERIRCQNTRRFTGSVDLNEVIYDSPWDYGIGFREDKAEVAIWIEPHPAYTSEVSTFLSKLEWLKGWLQNEAEYLWNLTQKSKTPFIWLATRGVHIPKKSRQARLLSEAGLPFPREVVELD